MCQIVNCEGTAIASRRSAAFYASYLRKIMGGPFDPPTSARVKSIFDDVYLGNVTSHLDEKIVSFLFTYG